MPKIHIPESVLGTVNETHDKMQQAIMDAVLEHKRSGNPIATWDGEKVVTVQPEEIEVLPQDD